MRCRGCGHGESQHDKEMDWCRESGCACSGWDGRWTGRRLLVTLEVSEALYEFWAGKMDEWGKGPEELVLAVAEDAVRLSPVVLGAEWAE